MAFQISLFDGTQPFKIDKPIRLIELFAGIGAQAKALENLGVDFEHYRICEFDKYAVKSYNAIHGTNFETSDITKITADDLSIVDTDKYCYVMTYSFPCQSLSSAGKGEGMAKGSGTRSGLLWEVERLLTETKSLPQVLLMENVPQVIGQKNMPDFAQWIAFLDGLGYKSKYALLNAKDYGIPQNRERCFMVSILGDYYYEFPSKKPLKKRLKDVLETEVDEKYYFSNKQLDKMNSWKSFQNPLDKVLGTESVSPTITTRIAMSDDGGINASTKLYSNQLKNESKIRQNYHDKGIRFYTPKECFRLMGFSDEDFEKSKKSIEALKLTALQKEGCLYKQAGNSIVVQVLEAIFKQML